MPLNISGANIPAVPFPQATTALIFLLIDIFQLAALIYLTGGIVNPFIIFIIIPSIFASSNLGLRTNLLLVITTTLTIIFLTFYLICLSLMLEILHYFIPERSFEISDLFGNFIGVIIITIIVYFFKKNENIKN